MHFHAALMTKPMLAGHACLHAIQLPLMLQLKHTVMQDPRVYAQSSVPHDSACALLLECMMASDTLSPVSMMRACMQSSWCSSLHSGI